MSYYHAKTVSGDLDSVEPKITEALKAEGFGVLTRIDVKETLKNKIDVDFRPYRILGACNPGFAHQALNTESRIGLMMPCNVVIQEVEGGVEISAVDPVASMSSVNNQPLEAIAGEVRDKLIRAVDQVA